MTDTITITAASKPVLPKGVRLTENPAQGWVLVAPERVFKADQIAVTILKRCDGKITVAGMADEFAAQYKAPRDKIEADIIALLQSLADKRLLTITDG